MVVSRRNLKLIKDSLFFFVSLSIAWWIIKTGFLHIALEGIYPVKFVADFVAGLFYATFLTSPISVAMLISLANEGNPIITAVVAGFGAMIGDLLVIRILKKDVTKDIATLASDLKLKRVKGLIRKYSLDALLPIIASLLIASPLPDEIGLVLLSETKLTYKELMALSYFLNTVGMLIIVLPFNLLS